MQNTARTHDTPRRSETDGGFTAPEGCRMIARADWERQRWDWLEGVRRDGGPGGLSPTARLLAHALVLDFANHRTARCDPTIVEIASAMPLKKGAGTTHQKGSRMSHPPRPKGVRFAQLMGQI